MANPDVSSSRSTTSSTTTSTARPTSPNIKPDHLRHRAGRVPRRLRIGVVLDHEGRRHLRRQALPDRHDLHGRLQAGRRVLERAEGRQRRGPRLGRHRRCLHRRLRRPTRTPSNAAQGLIDQGADVHPARRRRRSTRAPHPSSATPAATSRCSASTPTCTRPTRRVADLLLTSIRKAHRRRCLRGRHRRPAAATSTPTPFVGTLENEGVGLAPFHDFEDKVSPDLQGELDEITGRHHRRLDPRHVLPRRSRSADRHVGRSAHRPPHCVPAALAHGASTHPAH